MLPLSRGWHDRPALLTAAAVAVLGGDVWGEKSWGDIILADCPPMALMLFVAALALAIVAMFWSGTSGKPAPVRPLRRRSFLWIASALVIHLAVALAVCRALPAGNIDTYTIQAEAARTLLHGHDPYGGSQPNPYTAAETAKFYGPGMVVNGRVQVGIQYPPLTVLWVLPGYLLGDVRYSYVLAILLEGALLFAIAPNAWGLGLGLFLLLNPFTWWVENRCWTEPLALLMMSLAILAAKRFPRWLPLAFGLFLASKQYNILAVPLTLMLVSTPTPRKSIKLLLSSVLVAMATVLPFAIWNASGLFRDLVLFHLRQPFRADALSFAVFFPVMLKIGPVLVVCLLTAACWRLRGPAMFAASFGAAVLLLFTTSGQAFANYFFLAACSFLVAAVTIASERTTLATGVNPVRANPEHLERLVTGC